MIFRVRVRSCSIIFEKSVFVFVHVRANTNEHQCSLYTCSCSFIPDQAHIDSLKAEIAAIDSQMEGKKFLLADHITIADFFVFSILLTLDEMTDFEVEGENIPMFMNRMKGLLFSYIFARVPPTVDFAERVRRPRMTH